MIKKVFLILFSIICFTQAAFSQGVFRITSVNFDTSNSLVFLTSPDETTEAIMQNVKLIKLQNPKRVYFDINSAVLTKGTQNWFLNSGGVKQVKVSQFSTNPGKVRVVLYLDEKFDQSKISFLKVNNNIVINFKDGMCGNDYFQNTYRDEHNNSSDFYENLSISNEKLDAAVKSIPPEARKNDYLNEAAEAPISAKLSPIQTSDVIKKELKLKSKYYLNAIFAKPNGFLISGFGVVGIEKPMYLTNPARVAFDIPNAVASPDLKGKEFKIGEDTIRLGQFELNKVRVVITSNELEKYLPVFSSDGQSIFMVKNNAVVNEELFSKTTDATGYYVKPLNPLTDEFIITFNSPVVHSIRRDDTKLTINLFNALRYNEEAFRNTINPTGLDDMRIDLLPRVGLRLITPIEKDNLVNCYLGSDGKSIKLVIRRIKPKNPNACNAKTIILPKHYGKSTVVLDPAGV